MAATRATKKTAAARSTRRVAEEAPLEDEIEFAHDVVDYLKEYAREKPEVVCLWCLGIGFILGWKLKPW